MPDALAPARKIRTIDLKVKGDPFSPEGYGEIIKPGELVDIVELSPLTRNDRVIYNLLLANAWENIGKPIVHKIEKAKLKGSHYGNERIEDTILRLMGTVAIARVKNEKTGRMEKVRVQLLGENREEMTEKGFLYYTIPESLLQLITSSEIYARLKSHVMFCLGSKYAICLYEMVEKRKNLSLTQSEEFTIKEFREFLNVPKGKLERFADLNRRVLKPAADEVNGVTDSVVFLQPIKQGRKVVKIKMSWYPKTPEARRKAFEEVERHSAGRKARLEGRVEQVSLQTG